jgi:hypothetical protein
LDPYVVYVTSEFWIFHGCILQWYLHCRWEYEIY